MRILQISATYGWGCTGRIIADINEMIIQSDNMEGYIAWGRKNILGNSFNIYRIGGAKDYLLHAIYTRLTDKCGFGSKLATYGLCRKISDINPDIVHIHILHGYYINIEILFSYLKKKEIPLVWTFHDCWAFTGHCVYFDMAGCEKWKSGCHNCEQRKKHPKSIIVDNSAFNWSKKRDLFNGLSKMCIVTPSEWLKTLVRQSFFYNIDTMVVNNGIDTNIFHYRDSLLKEMNGWHDKSIVLGVSSTWAQSKGLSDFLKLADQLSDEYIVVLVGVSNKQKKNFPHNICGIPKTDDVIKLAEFYSIADVFVNMSYEDNFPTTIIEAIACGTPVVTYDTGGCGELVRSLNNGKICEQGDIKSVKNFIKSKPLRNTNVDLATYDSRTMCRKYLDIYKNLIGD